MLARMQGFAVCLLAGTLAACGSSEPSGTGQVSFNAASAPVGTPANTFTLNGNILVVTRVRLVLNKIKLKRSDKNGDCDSLSSEDCGNIHVPPTLLDLPLTPGAAQVFSVALPVGLYNQVQLEVHKPSSSSAEDAALLAANPEFNGVSVEVTGTYNGVPYTFTSDGSAKEKLDLTPALEVVSAGTVNLTFLVNLRAWFLNAAETDLIDPATALAGQPNESQVEKNIKESCKTFQDENKDGKSDP